MSLTLLSLSPVVIYPLFLPLLAGYTLGQHAQALNAADMAKKSRGADSRAPLSSSSVPMPGQNATRRRGTVRDIHSSSVHGETVTPKVINAAPLLEKAEMYGIDDERPASSRIMALFGRMFMETIPYMLTVGVMLGLIFGGCCSNVNISLCRGALAKHQRLLTLKIRYLRLKQ